MRFTERSRQKNHGYSRKIQSVHWIYNIKTMYVSLSMSKFTHVMNATNNGKGRIYMDECADTSILLLNYNGFTGVSRTLRPVNMVGLNKYI